MTPIPYMQCLCRDTCYTLKTVFSYTLERLALIERSYTLMATLDQPGLRSISDIESVEERVKFGSFFWSFSLLAKNEI